MAPEPHPRCRLLLLAGVVGLLFAGALLPASTMAEIRATMGTRPPLAEQAEAAMREWITTGRMDVSDDEIAAAVNSNLGRMRMRRVTSIGRAYTLGYDWFSEQSLGADGERSEGLRSVTAADVARASEKYFVEGPMVSVVVK